MRKPALIALAALVAALSIAFAAARGTAAAPQPTLARALVRTAHVASLRYAFHIGIKRDGVPVALRIRGQSDARTISVRVATSAMSAQEVVDGPFLYEEAPDGMVVDGRWRWLRIDLGTLRPDSSAVAALHALTPAPLLRVIGEGKLFGTHSVYRGGVAYDDPIVRASLARLTAGLEFRQLRLTVWVGRDGLVHRLRLTGRTADHSSSLLLTAHLFGFNRPVHVSPPKPGTFIDKQLAQLDE